MKQIVHELNQLDYGGVEKVIKNIIKYDKVNQHTILTYKDGPFRKEFEDIGAKVVMPNPDGDLDMEADIIHIHSGGGISQMATNLGEAFCVIETIHSPVRSPMHDKCIRQRVGVCDAVSKMNSNCITIKNGIEIVDHELESIVTLKKELGIPEGLPVVGRLGRIGPDKGLEDWLLTCYRLQQNGYKFVPLIVGGEARGHEGKYIGRLKLIAESLPVKGIVWAGHRTDIENMFQLMDVFLYPSPTEGFGLVFAEAILSGCVVVTYNTPVTLELFGGYSILTKQSIHSLVQGVECALTSEDLKMEISGIGPDFIRSEYSAKRMSKDYQDLYERCN